MFLEISRNSQENTCARASFLIKLQAEACNFILKETLALVFSCESCQISKNTFCYSIIYVSLYYNKMSQDGNRQKWVLRFNFSVTIYRIYTITYYLVHWWCCLEASLRAWLRHFEVEITQLLVIFQFFLLL